eukprot:TRINITY_DN2248_c0_g1_i1.p1 TRINITY_DN2248_c0_g1~~TRINITY_DN2248_c0_g1_i1.p1  ORF type:complete len:159 (-),score=38.46 TRINITY_DN2248_c0_g1_i1:76-552(-)
MSLQEKVEEFLQDFSPVLEKHACTIEVQSNEGASNPKAANSFVASCSDSSGRPFRAIAEDEWKVVTRTEAQEILTSLIHKDLATGTKIFELSDAKRLSSLFFQCFVNGTFYTNGTWKPGSDVYRLENYSKISADEMDSGIIAFGGPLVGLVWFLSNHD